jgi:truncated hemoglobin YjbI
MSTNRAKPCRMADSMLYDRLGGREGVRVVVDEFYD